MAEDILLIVVGLVIGYCVGYWLGYWDMHRSARAVEKFYIADNEQLRRELTEAKVELSGADAALDVVEELMHGEEDD